MAALRAETWRAMEHALGAGKARSIVERRKARSIRYRIKRALRRGHTLTAKRIIQDPAVQRYLSALVTASDAAYLFFGWLRPKPYEPVRLRVEQ